MPELPIGTVTFLFSDVEGSTSLWERSPEEMRLALARHDALVGEHVAAHDGVLVKSRGEGDSSFAVFARASAAVAAAGSLQRALSSEPFLVSLKVRIALHTGEAELRDGDYFGSAVNRCARLRSIAHGGQVLVSTATEALVRDALPQHASLRDLGEQRLRDLTRPERVYQLCHPDLPAEFPPLTSLDAYSTNLPLQLTSFVGRKQEIAEAKRLLTSTRLLTLTGTGGCGKTRLAYQVAADLVEEYADGVWVVELAPIADSQQVDRALAYVLGIREEPGQPVVGALIAYLKPKRLLLVLDNCEHLIEASARLVESLLRACPHLQALATSRELLGVPGEVAYRVPSLATPDAHELPPTAELARLEAVRLLVERAQLAQPGFVLTEQNASGVAAICSRLDGIPLALELAAARLATMTADQVAARLSDRFRLLTGGSRTVLRRQQTLRAAIDWSHDLLSESERVALRRLAVFVGGCGLEAAEQVCGGEDVEAWEVDDLLASLARKSLVVVEEVGGGARHRLLETVRQYALEKLAEAGEADVVRARHRDWCLDLAEQAGADVPVTTSDEWFEQLEVEHDNLRTALAWCLERDVRGGLAIAGQIGLFWYLGAYFAEGHRWLSDLLMLAPADLEPHVRGLALTVAGWLARGLGRVVEARQQMEEGFQLLRTAQAGKRLWAGFAAYQLALTALTRGDEAEAESLYGESRRLWSESESPSWASTVDVDLAVMHLSRGELGAARDLLRRVERTCRAVGPQQNYAYAREYLGYLATVEGDLETARSLLEECLAYYRAKRRWFRACVTLYWLSLTALEDGQPEQARALLASAVDVARRVGSRPLMGASLFLGAVLAGAWGDFGKVASLLGAASGEQQVQSGAGGQAIPTMLVRGRAKAVASTARSTLGEEAFDRAFAEGLSMTLDQAVEYALADDHE